MVLVSQVAPAAVKYVRRRVYKTHFLAPGAIILCRATPAQMLPHYECTTDAAQVNCGQCRHHGLFPIEKFAP